jgi:hypothetical protein
MIKLQYTALLFHNNSRPTVIPTGMHYPSRTKSVMIELQYTASAEQPSTGTSFMLNPPSEPQDLNSEPGMGSNDQMELSRYKRLYSQAREDLENLNGQAKRRSIQSKLLFLQLRSRK